MAFRFLLKSSLKSFTTWTQPIFHDHHPILLFLLPPPPLLLLLLSSHSIHFPSHLLLTTLAFSTQGKKTHNHQAPLSSQKLKKFCPMCSPGSTSTLFHQPSRWLFLPYSRGCYLLRMRNLLRYSSLFSSGSNRWRWRRGETRRRRRKKKNERGRWRLKKVMGCFCLGFCFCFLFLFFIFLSFNLWKRKIQARMCWKYEQGYVFLSFNFSHALNFSQILCEWKCLCLSFIACFLMNGSSSVFVCVCVCVCVRFFLIRHDYGFH